jgi:hypothetical protein
METGITVTKTTGGVGMLTVERMYEESRRTPDKRFHSLDESDVLWQTAEVCERLDTLINLQTEVITRLEKLIELNTDS